MHVGAPQARVVDVVGHEVGGAPRDRLGVGQDGHARHGGASRRALERAHRVAPARVERLRARRQLLVGADDVHDRVDERQVRERLREVAQVAAGARVDLLGEQAERAGVAEQLLAQLARPARLADLGQRADQPERADRERALLAAQAVVGLLDAVAQDEPVDRQLVGDRVDGADDALVLGRQEAHERREQQRRVERVGVVVLGEHAAVVEAVREHVGVDLVGDLLPALGLLVGLAQPRQPRAAVARDPAHDLRRREVLGLAAHLPDPAVGLAPVRDRLLDLVAQDRPEAVGQPVARLRVQVERVDSFYLHTKSRDGLPDRFWPILSKQVEQAITHWREPDRGIWEVRGEPKHFTSSKIMCWVACDRGARLARLREDEEQRRALAGGRRRDPRRRARERRSTSAACSSSTTSTDALDASLLLVPLVRFLPPDDERIVATVNAIADELTVDGLVLRYQRRGDRRRPERRGGHVRDLLVLAGQRAGGDRRDRAGRGSCARSCSATRRRSALYAEEIDPRSGRHLGNFPQAFTHLALINAVMHVIRADHELAASAAAARRAPPRRR